MLMCRFTKKWLVEVWGVCGLFSLVYLEPLITDFCVAPCISTKYTMALARVNMPRRS